jgi:hypothetical protein
VRACMCVYVSEREKGKSALYTPYVFVKIQYCSETCCVIRSFGGQYVSNVTFFFGVRGAGRVTLAKI